MHSSVVAVAPVFAAIIAPCSFAVYAYSSVRDVASWSIERECTFTISNEIGFVARGSQRFFISSIISLFLL